MRPTRLEIEGFASYRDRVDIDFTDADLFVLSGPTGAGKSSVIDAMVFALYGTVPRYNDRRAVEPVISQAAQEARVRFTFEVDHDTYTATRVVRRGSGTKEARLERWTAPDGSATLNLAERSDELTEAVERLLGLGYDHFTSCVVLPQGAFQQFLHAKGQQRQDLLIQLLDLELYRTIGRAARDRASYAKARATSLQERLDGTLAGATDEALQQAGVRVDQLTTLAAHVDDTLPTLRELLDVGRARADAATVARARLDTLRTVEVPSDIAALTNRVQAHDDAIAQADAGVAAASGAVEAATAAQAALPDAAAVRTHLDLLERHERTVHAITAARDDVATASAAQAAAASALDDADAALTHADTAVQHARDLERAAVLRADLTPGDDCPVCLQEVHEVPDQPPSDALQSATVAREQAATARVDAAAVAAAASSALTVATGTLTTHEQELQRLAEAIRASTLPGAEADLQSLAATVQQATADLAAARAAEQDARATARRVRADAAAAADELKAAWAGFDRTWTSVAELQPPPADRDDLAGSWAALRAWADQRIPELERAHAQADQEVQGTREAYRDTAAELEQRFADAGLAWDPDLDRIGAAIHVELDRARTALGTLRERLDEVESTRKELAETTRTRQVGEALGQELRSNNFERWLLDRALRHLVVNASRALRELSDDAYSLAIDDRSNFQIIDHRNADQERSVRTLSGGETFLASLALALALSEHVADLATKGAARLDTLILDEGFGSLDPTTLDIVAAALSNLGATGRTVGVITHVASLAEQLPVRYEVRKDAGTSVIDRVAG